MKIFSHVKQALGTTMLVLLCATFGFAGVCTVPSGPYPTIQSAVDDPSCTEIVLAAQTFEESVTVVRDLTLRGASSATTLIEGQLAVQGGSTEVALHDLTVDAGAPGVAGLYTAALRIEGGSKVEGVGIVILNAVFDPFAIFTDGFESGDTTAWSSVVP